MKNSQITSQGKFYFDQLHRIEITGSVNLNIFHTEGNCYICAKYNRAYHSFGLQDGILAVKNSFSLSSDDFLNTQNALSNQDSFSFFHLISSFINDSYTAKQKISNQNHELHLDIYLSKDSERQLLINADNLNVCLNQVFIKQLAINASNLTITNKQAMIHSCTINSSNIKGSLLANDHNCNLFIQANNLKLVMDIQNYQGVINIKSNLGKYIIPDRQENANFGLIEIFANNTKIDFNNSQNT